MDEVRDNANNEDEITNDEEEMEALGRIAQAFKDYRISADVEVHRWEQNYSRLSQDHMDLLHHIPPKIAAARHCIYQNHLFFKSMLDWLSPETAPSPLCFAPLVAQAWAAKHGPGVGLQDADKVRYVLKNLMRDWSTEGAEERAESYGLIQDTMSILFKDQLTAALQGTSEPPKVLVPGCGLARLCVELSHLGFDTLGNEHSYYMLLASAFLLNGTDRAEQWTLFPWAHNSSNNACDADQIRPITIPDVHPMDIMAPPGTLGMAAGEFVQVFNCLEYAGHFDAVVTCFFLDTAHNVVEYMETIWKVLKQGGWWINLGPLQWHWADAHTYLPGEELSVELSLADVEHVARRLGFVFKQRETGRKCRYMSNNKSMLSAEYQCAFWSAQKPPLAV